MDIRTVDLNLLKAFDALMTERAVTRAASRISLSQPAMSHALARLRLLFGDPMFVRNASGMEPTARALEIAPLIAAAIERIETALNLGTDFDPAQSTATFTAGIAEGAEATIIGHLAHTFSRQAPDATLRLKSVSRADSTEQLDRGIIDVGIARMMKFPERFHSQALMQDPMVILARRGHPLAGRSLSVETYADLGHVFVTPQGNMGGSVDHFLATLGMKRRIALYLSTNLALPAALAATDLIATVPRRIARQIATMADVEIMALPIDMPTTISMAWHRRTASEAAQVWFRSLLIAAAAD